MRDSDLTERPGKDWTPWTTGAPRGRIDAVWWEARQLHFPKLNVTVWFDGSEMVGLEHWGYRREQWCMKKLPADHPPMPAELVQRRQQEAVEAGARMELALEACRQAGNLEAIKADSLEDALNNRVSEHWDIGQRMFEVPAHTLEGMLIKIRGSTRWASRAAGTMAGPYRQSPTTSGGLPRAVCHERPHANPEALRHAARSRDRCG